MKSEFAQWLRTSTQYQPRVCSDLVSRLKRANSILTLPEKVDMYYVFQLQQHEEYRALSTSVRSQIKKAVLVYFEFLNQQDS